MKQMSAILFSFFQSYWIVCQGETLEVTHESSCSDASQFYQLDLDPVTVLWRHYLWYGCRLFFIPSSPDHRVCFTLRNINSRTNNRKIYISYLQGSDEIPLQVFGSKIATGAVTCGKRGTRMIVGLGSPFDHVDNNSSISFSIFQEDKNYVPITNDCFHGYSTLDYVVDQQPINIQWTVNDVSSCHLHFRPSSALSKICVTVKEMMDFTSNSTRIYIKYPVNGERLSLKTINNYSSPGEKICVLIGTTLMVRFYNADRLEPGKNVSATLHVVEEKIGYHEGDPIIHESSCSEASQFYIDLDPITVSWRHIFRYGCRLFFIPSSPEYRVCFTLRNINSRTNSRKIYLSYLQGSDEFPLQVLGSKSSTAAVTCGERGTKMIVGVGSASDVDSYSSISFSIFQEDKNYVPITHDCYHGYSTLDYVVDQQPINIQWTVNDTSSCHLHFRPSSARSRICVSVEEMTDFTPNGTRIYIKYPMNGERVSLKTINKYSSTGEKICVLTGTTLMVRLYNADRLEPGQIVSATLYVFEEKIGYHEGGPIIQFPVWIVIFALSITFMLTTILYVIIIQCREQKVPEEDEEDEEEESKAQEDIKNTEISSAIAWVSKDYY